LAFERHYRIRLSFRPPDTLKEKKRKRRPLAEGKQEQETQRVLELCHCQDWKREKIQEIEEKRPPLTGMLGSLGGSLGLLWMQHVSPIDGNVEKGIRVRSCVCCVADAGVCFAGGNCRMMQIT
jgi:hypothetical protein